MIAVTDVTYVTASVIGFFALFSIITLARIILRREDPGWRRFRVGFFVERDKRGEDQDSR